MLKPCEGVGRVANLCLWPSYAGWQHLYWCPTPLSCPIHRPFETEKKTTTTKQYIYKYQSIISFFTK